MWVLKHIRLTLFLEDMPRRSGITRWNMYAPNDPDLWPSPKFNNLNDHLQFISTSYDQPTYRVRRSLSYEFFSYWSDKVCIRTNEPTYRPTDIWKAIYLQFFEGGIRMTKLHVFTWYRSFLIIKNRRRRIPTKN